MGSSPATLYGRSVGQKTALVVIVGTVVALLAIAGIGVGLVVFSTHGPAGMMGSSGMAPMHDECREHMRQGHNATTAPAAG